MEPRPVAPLFGNWPYDPTTASLTLRSGHHPEASITSEVVKMWLKTAQQSGFARVRTNAVSPQLAGILATVGFSVKQELSLLTAPLQNLSPAARSLRGLGPSRLRRNSGYCLSGFTASSADAQYGYIQRLAVHPSAQRSGYGRKLALDTLHWLGSRGMQHALVNTDSTNVAALSLYGSLGFVPMPYSLYVLERACTG